MLPTKKILSKIHEIQENYINSLIYKNYLKKKITKILYNSKINQYIVKYKLTL